MHRYVYMKCFGVSTHLVRFTRWTEPQNRSIRLIEKNQFVTSFSTLLLADCTLLWESTAEKQQCKISTNFTFNRSAFLVR